MHPERLPLSKQIAYALGQLGWSMIINVITLQLLYFYIPPADAGIPIFITQVTFLLILNTLTLIAASGRLLDAITDPWIAHLSDRWKSPRGRRIPFLRFGAVPTAIFGCLMFFPIVPGESGWNIIWLLAMQSLFYVCLTTYVTPYFALLPELGHNATEKLNLSTWISATYALGIIVAAQVPVIAGVLETALSIGSRVASLQYAIAIVAGISVIFMLIPTFFIDENRYTQPGTADIPLREAVLRTFKNEHFRYYVLADFSYFTGLTIIMTGLLYYITVLLGLAEDMMGILVPMMLLVSFAFYPIVNILAKKVGKKVLVTGSFAAMSGIFLMIFFLGRMPVSTLVQGYMLVGLFALPIAFLAILPNAILADIADHDARETGIKQEGMFFAARTLMQKFGQTFGVLIFAALTSLGKDPGNDFGIRLSGVIGCILCFAAAMYFRRYREEEVLIDG